MEFRKARRSEILAIAELWTHTFPGSRPLAERVQTLESGGRHGGIETVVVAEEDGRIAGALKTTPYTQYVAGGELPMLGLAAVAVAPWARRRGVGASLCGHALDLARERGDVVSVLYPFRPEFYRRLGWGMVGELHSYRFAPEQLADVGDPDVHLAGPGDMPDVQAAYDRVARRSNGMIHRDEPQWKRHVESPASHVYIARRDRVNGYMIVRYGTAKSADRRPLYVRELVAEDDDAYSRLLGWISRQRDLWRRVRYDASPDEHFALRLTDPRPPGHLPSRWLWAEAGRIIRGPMFRVLDVERAFGLRPTWGPAAPFAFTLEVEDVQLPGNRGPWRIGFDGSSATVSPLAGTAGGEGRTRPGVAGLVEPGREGSTIRLAVDAATLAQLYAGEVSVSAAARHGTARVDGDVSRLDAFFRPPSSFRLLDEF